MASTGHRKYLIVAIVLLLTLQQPQASVNGLVLLPLPGYFITSAVVKKMKTKSSTKKPKGIIEQYEKGNGKSENTSVSSIRSPPKTQSSSIGTATSYVKMSPTTTIKKPTSEKDMLISKAAKLRQSIVRRQDRLITIERQIACYTDIWEAPKSNNNWISNSITSSNNLVVNGITNSISSSSSLATNVATRLVRTFQASSNVFLRKIDRVQNQIGPKNQMFEGRVGNFVMYQIFAGLRIASKLATEPSQIKQIVTDPRTPTLVPHAPAILARLDQLEVHVRPIIEGVLNDRQHLASIEPYLVEILERFDDIEPHLAWILENIDALAPYTGLLLKHIDALLLYANSDNLVVEEELEKGNNPSSSYSLADQLLPHLEYYVSNLDTIGPHLVLLRPHVPLLLKHNRIAKISPHIDKLFARGYETQLAASANIDVLLFWFGWTLRIPYLPALFFALPFSPALVSFLVHRLPKKFARQGPSYCRNLECAIDDDYGGSWNKLDKA